LTATNSGAGVETTLGEDPYQGEIKENFMIRRLEGKDRS